MESLDQKQQQQLSYLLPNLQKWGILLLDTLFFMSPMGKGTYGSKVGRPKAKKTTKKTTKKKPKKM